MLRYFNGERIVFLINNTTITGPYMIPYTKSDLKCIIDLNIRAKTIKIIVGKGLGEDLYDFVITMIFFLDGTQKI